MCLLEGFTYLPTLELPTFVTKSNYTWLLVWVVPDISLGVLAKLLCIVCFTVPSSETGRRPEDSLAAAGPTDQ